MKVGEETAELDNPESFFTIRRAFLHDFSCLRIYLGMGMWPVLVFLLVFVSIVGVLPNKRLHLGQSERLGRLAATAVGEARVHKPSRTRLLQGFECSGPADCVPHWTHCSCCRILEHDKAPFLTMATVSVTTSVIGKRHS